MQLGLTIPLQKHLKCTVPPCGEVPDLAFCWDLHLMRMYGKRGLLLVNSNNRYAIYLHNMHKADWVRLPELATEHITRALEEAGLPRSWVNRYLLAAGAPELTKTHGRKPVAGLNRVGEDLQWFDPELFDSTSLAQPRLDCSLNKIIAHAAGFPDWGIPVEFLRADFERLFGGL